MRRNFLSLLILISANHAYDARAAWPRHEPCARPGGVCATWCCDDYCRKPLPSLSTGSVRNVRRLLPKTTAWTATRSVRHL